MEIKSISLNKLVKKESGNEYDNDIIDGLFSYLSRILIFGDGGVGKSLFTLELIMRMMIGEGPPFFEEMNRKPAGVVYFQKENSEIIMQQRVKSMMKGLGVSKINNVWFTQAFHLDSNDDYLLDDVIKYIAERDAEILVFDPLIDFHCKDERSNAEMRGVMNNISYIMESTEAISIIVHHASKGYSRNARNRVRGASSIYDWCHTSIELRGFEGGVKMNFVKTNHTPKMDSVELVRNEYLLHDLQQPKEGKCTVDMVVKALRNLKIANTKKQLIEKVMKLADCSFNTADKMVNEALEQKKVKKEGRTWKI